MARLERSGKEEFELSTSEVTFEDIGGNEKIIDVRTSFSVSFLKQ